MSFPRRVDSANTHYALNQHKWNRTCNDSPKYLHEPKETLQNEDKAKPFAWQITTVTISHFVLREATIESLPKNMQTHSVIS